MTKVRPNSGKRVSPGGSLTPAGFWRLVDTARVAAEYRGDADLNSLPHSSLVHVKKVLTPYRFFNLYYITDLAFLTSRLPLGRLRSHFAHLLDNELGSGDPARSHPALYDAFLRSLGVAENDLYAAQRDCLSALERVRRAILAGSWAYGAGLRGLGGECLSREYLEVVFQTLQRHPVIRSRRKKIDWRFWDLHLGEEDNRRCQETRAVIDELLTTDSSQAGELASGYVESTKAWEDFWRAAHQQGRSHARQKTGHVLTCPDGPAPDSDRPRSLG